uniref:Uncharacterized protein n=1 Tax=Moniliophthora roreri TaxID=221103 RepID=A0A0W0FLY0_MONRR
MTSAAAAAPAPAPASTPAAEFENKYDEEQGTMVLAPEKKSYMQWLKEEVDPKECTAPLAAFCFMTGFMDAISFSAVFVWCGFQTGNFVQVRLPKSCHQIAKF